MTSPDPYADLKAALDKTSTAWRPEPGDVVAGTIVDLDEREGEYGPYPVLLIDTGGDDLTAVHCFHTVLRNEIAHRRPSPGDKIAIRYDGKDKYHAYTIRHIRLVPASTDPRPAQRRADLDVTAAGMLDTQSGDEPF